MGEEKIIREVDDKDEEIYQVLKLALEAGRILLRSGAEIFRVEETMHRICKYYGYDNVDTFTVSNAIIVSLEGEKRELFAKVKNVPMSGAHLEIVAEINDLSRQIEAGLYTIDEAFEKLKEIEKIKPNSGLAQACSWYGEWLSWIYVWSNCDGRCRSIFYRTSSLYMDCMCRKARTFKDCY